jgi:drug/metabolite transporter (DMT)-like permease
MRSPATHVPTSLPATRRADKHGGDADRWSKRAVMRTRHERHGLLFAALCAANAAFVPAIAKLTTGHAEALFVAAASNLFAALCAAALLALRGELALMTRRGLAPRLLIIGALGTTAAHLFFYVGASRTSAIVTTLCLQIEPAYSLLLAWAFLGHRPTRRRVAATAVLLGGIVLALGAADLAAGAGVWLLLATPLCWQVSHLVVLRSLAGVPPVILTSARYLYGGVLLGLLWVVFGDRAALPAADALARLVPLLAVQGCVLGYAGTLFWYQAIARLDLARATAIVVPSIPLLSLAASFALLGEVASLRQWLGIVLTAAGILAFVTAPHPDEPRERIPTATAPIAAEP